MGTAQLAFEGEYWGATGSHKTVSHVTGSHTTGSRVTGSVLCACTTGSWSISALLGPFYLLVGSDVPGSDVTGSGRNWMYVLRMRGFFPRYFLHTRVPWLPNVTKGHQTRSGFHSVCACVNGSYTISAPDRKWRLFFLLFFIFFSFFLLFFSIYFHINVIISDIFFHTTCSTSNNTTFCTKVLASTGFPKSLMTSIMLCPAHRYVVVVLPPPLLLLVLLLSVWEENAAAAAWWERGNWWYCDVR